MVDKLLGLIFPPKPGYIETSDWFRAQAIQEGSLKSYPAEDIVDTGYRVFEWGNGRHRKPTKVKRKYQCPDGTFVLATLPKPNYGFPGGIFKIFGQTFSN